MTTNNKLAQSEAVFQAISNVCGKVDEGTAYSPSSEERGQVNAILAEGFKAGRIELKDTPSNAAKLADDSELRNYCSGLISNWLRKDKRLNGGVKYEAKNPGSRAGSTDPQVKAMRMLLASKDDSKERAEIQAFIDKRVALIKPAKAVAQIDVSALPEELQHMVS